MKLNLHLNATPMNSVTESRTGRSVDMLLEYKIFDHIDIAAVEDNESEYSKDKVSVFSFTRNYGVERAGLFQKIFGTLRWCIEVYLKLSPRKYQVINCHSLNLLPLAVLLKFKSKSKLIYDIHELETETFAMNKIRKFFSKIVENVLIGFVDFTIVVSDPIKSWYSENYNLKDIAVIKNMPSTKPVNITLSISMKEKFDIPRDNIIFVYHGALLKGRGIEKLTSIFSTLEDKKKHLVLIGFGDLEEMCRTYAKKNLNIHFNDAMEKNELLEFIKQADVGLNFIDNSCLNHEFCLPNKIWDYLSSSIPVMVSNLEGMRSVVDEYKCGWLVNDDKTSIKSAIESLSFEDVAIKKKNAKDSIPRWGWNHEKIKLLNIYKQIMNNHG